MFNLVQRWTIGFLLVASAAFSFGQEYQGKQLVQATLIADTTAVVPGQRMQLGLLLQMAPGWHTYWQFPGDVGIPTSIQWEPGTDLAGLTIEPLQWPLPERKELPGDIVDYAYSESVLLLMDVVVPENLAASEVTFSGKASWLVCEEICVPGDAPISLTLPVSKQAEPAHQELFAQARNALPKTSPPPFALQTSRVGKIFEISLENLPADTKVDFYPTPGEGQVVGHTKASEVIDGRAILRVPIEGDLRGVLVVDQSGERTGYSVALENPTDSQQQASGDETAAANLASGGLSLGLALVSGLLGGLILNLMPCVLPVISLKIFGFIKHAGEEPRKIFLHGLAFTAGIFAWFMGLALVIVLLKQSGQQVTWAFQFQNPIFNLAIGAIVLVFALNLFGVFEITLPGQAGSSMANLAAKDGYNGSFFQGVFATLLATPCTAPFLGNALGFAFSQSAWIILAMFGSIALGMAGPYLILSAQPAWMKFLPKPGPWMERVKQFMGFPLLATLVWLLFVLGGQKGVDGMIAALSFFVILALCCWIFGAFCSFGNSGKKRLLGAGAIAALLLLGIQFFLLGSFASARASAESKDSTSSIAWQDFSQAALNALLAEGKPVFVDFTADWCISCKFNERTAIDRPAVREALANAGIIPMKADWTNSNPEITAALKEFGRVGVPFYVLYPAGRKNEPIILPEILTEQIVLDAIAKASKEQ